jgi:histidinol phosphatase-like PHP family hydrolase
MHTHTHLSLCGGNNSTVANTVKEAEEVGLELLGISDHIDVRDSGRHRLFMADRDALARIDTDMTVLIGTEVSMQSPDRLAASATELAVLDYWVAAANHYHLGETKHGVLVENPTDKTFKGYAAHHLEMISGAIRHGANIIAHPFNLGKVGAVELDAELSAYDRVRLREVVAEAAEARCAFELNPSHLRGFPLFFQELIELAREEGAPLSQGSDGHHPGQMGYGGPEGIKEASQLFDDLGFTLDQLVTVEELTSRGALALAA